jgi:hypothetical protein
LDVQISRHQVDHWDVSYFFRSSVSDTFVETVMKSNGLVSGKVGCVWVGMFIQQLFIVVGWVLTVLLWGMLIDPTCPGTSL